MQSSTPLSGSNARMSEFQAPSQERLAPLQLPVQLVFQSCRALARPRFPQEHRSYYSREC
eukprot:9323234-Pyramimonas_sp.AAC.1